MKIAIHRDLPLSLWLQEDCYEHAEQACRQVGVLSSFAHPNAHSLNDKIPQN